MRNSQDKNYEKRGNTMESDEFKKLKDTIEKESKCWKFLLLLAIVSSITCLLTDLNSVKGAALALCWVAFMMTKLDAKRTLIMIDKINKLEEKIND